MMQCTNGLLFHEIAKYLEAERLPHHTKSPILADVHSCATMERCVLSSNIQQRRSLKGLSLDHLSDFVFRWFCYCMYSMNFIAVCRIIALGSSYSSTTEDSPSTTQPQPSTIDILSPEDPTSISTTIFTFSLAPYQASLPTACIYVTASLHTMRPMQDTQLCTHAETRIDFVPRHADSVRNRCGWCWVKHSNCLQNTSEL
jgi:hypothetical protein